MACSIDIQPEFVPSEFCGGVDYPSPLAACNQFGDYLDNETALDELWRVQGFPTPPTSPERVYSPSDDLEDDSESDSSQDLPMLNELILLAYGEEVLANAAASSLPIASDTDLQDQLIQDCMWSSHICDRDPVPKKKPLAPLSLAPLNLAPRMRIADGGVYTPAPSPPPPLVANSNDSAQETELEAMESDCVSPSVVFPSLLTPTSAKTPLTKVGDHSIVMDTEKSSVLRNIPECVTVASTERVEPVGVETSRRRFERERGKRRLSTAAVGTGSNNRVQPLSESSTSDEEIDVVTVPVSERQKLSRKRSLPLSAPCSRQSSPHPPTKRKKYHTKRLQRLSSAGSSGDGVESDDEARRASHNVLERKRRNDLKSSFQRLREEVPELEDNQRAPKVTILRKAMDFIRRMQERDRKAEEELVSERRRKARLLERLNQLRAGRT